MKFITIAFFISVVILSIYCKGAIRLNVNLLKKWLKILILEKHENKKHHKKEDDRSLFSDIFNFFIGNPSKFICEFIQGISDFLQGNSTTPGTNSSDRMCK